MVLPWWTLPACSRSTSSPPGCYKIETKRNVDIENVFLITISNIGK